MPVDCSWGVLENYSKLGPDYLKKTNALRSKYHPIELDLTISLGKRRFFEFSEVLTKLATKNLGVFFAYGPLNLIAKNKTNSFHVSLE